MEEENNYSEAGLACLSFYEKDPLFFNDDPSDFINADDVAKHVDHILNEFGVDYTELMNESEWQHYVKIKQNPYKLSMPIYKHELMHVSKRGTDIVKCRKCSGTGIYLYPHSCWTCDGTGKAVYEPLSDKQVGFIRSLFKQVQTCLSDDEKQYIVEQMKGYIGGSTKLDKFWGSALINFLKSHK